jgi:hypothetical protein
METEALDQGLANPALDAIKHEILEAVQRVEVTLREELRAAGQS